MLHTSTCRMETMDSALEQTSDKIVQVYEYERRKNKKDKVFVACDAFINHVHCWSMWKSVCALSSAYTVTATDV